MPNGSARYNALKPGDGLRSGEVLALPGRASAALTGTTGQIIGGPNSGGPIDVSTIATTALDRVGPSPTTAPRTSGAEPVRHKVARGETAFTIARSYNVSAKSLADWEWAWPRSACARRPVPDHSGGRSSGTAVCD